jgi:hypothetical protein
MASRPGRPPVPPDLPASDHALAVTLAVAARVHALGRPEVREAVRAAVERAKAHDVPAEAVLLGLMRCIEAYVAPHVADGESLEFTRHATRWALEAYHRRG